MRYKNAGGRSVLTYAEVDLKSCTEYGFGYCTVCGKHGLFLSYEPIDAPCKRNGFICENCGSVGRNRHIAHTIINEFASAVNCDSLTSFGERFEGNIWIGCVKEAVSKSLGEHSNITKSEFIDGLNSGQVQDGVLCQDIQQTTFPGDFFDLIISEDVLEHVPDPEKAFSEIRRVLRPGGKHIFTIPVVWEAEYSYARAVIENGEIKHLHEPEIHGDPFRPDGVLAFSTFGRDVVSRFCSITGPTRMLTAHGDRMLERGFFIYNNWVFVSEKV